ncbi:MAG: twin-arginine translocase TatA/TatE family subunit [Ilumatobacteraceae bacterium]
MFNIEGSELIFLLLIALVVLGPEKLPEAVRKFTKGYAEFKKMASGFQGELRDVLDEPMRELRGTADAMREAAKFELDLDEGSTKSGAEKQAGVSEIKREPGLNFGSANPKQAAPTPRRETGLNFGSANPRRQTRIARADDTGAVETAADAPAPTAPAGDPAVDTSAPDAPAVAEDTTE